MTPFVSQYGVFTDADHDGYDDNTDYYFNFVDENQDGYDDNSGIYFGFPEGYDPAEYQTVTNGMTEEEAQANRENYVARVQSEIQAVGNIANITYRSKEEGVLSLRDQVGEDYASLFDDEYIYGSDNNLPDSFVVTVSDLSQLQSTIDQIQALDEVYSIQASTQVASTMTTLRQVINVVGWVIVAALVVVSLVIITNTIRASIYSRRKEINIMKYVGATNALYSAALYRGGHLPGHPLSGHLLRPGQRRVLLSPFRRFHFHFRRLGAAALWPDDPLRKHRLGIGPLLPDGQRCAGVAGSLISIRKHIKV